MKDRIARRWHRLRRKLSGDRGFVEAGVAAAGAVLVVGALVGNGVAATIIDMSDGQTWLPDGEGRIVQINPATGQPERRLIVGDEGSELEISQRDGHLLVTDANSGAVTAIDLASLIASGSRGMGDGETKVLLGGGQVALATLDPGTIRAVDPLTLADRGRPYRTDALADAVMDDAGEAWLLSTDGMLRSITFNPTSRTWALDTERPVDGAGRASRLIPHAAGVTVAGPDGGVIVQVGAGRDLAASVPGLVGQIKPAERSPADLVPVSVPDEGSVVLLADRQALTVAVRDIGCDRPDVPAVHAGRVYVPCHGQGRVIVLDRDGSRAAEDILVPGGADASLVVDEGRLVVRSPNEGRIVVVQTDGSTSMIDLSATQVPEHDIHRPTPARPGGAGGPGASPAGGSGPLPSGTPDRPTPEGTTPPASTGEATIAPDRDEATTTAPDTPATSENPAPGAELDPDPADPVADGPPEPDPTDAEQREDDTDPAGREDPDPATEEESEGGGATPGDATTSPGAPGPGDDPSSSPPPATTPPTTTPPTTAPPPITTPPTTTPPPTTVPPTTPPSTTPPPTTPPPTTPPPTTPPPTTPPPTTPPPAQASAAGSVSAEALADGTARVTWLAASSGADNYLVRPQGGASTTVGGSATSVVLENLTPGATLRFEVETRLGDSTAVSAPSNSVTIPNVPGAVSSLSASMASRDSGQVRIAVSFAAANGNGSTVTGYRVAYAGGGVSGSTTITSTSTTLAISCGGQQLCSAGGSVEISVTASNAIGQGPSTSATVAVPAPPPPPPANGDMRVSDVYHGTPAQSEWEIPMYATLVGHPSWSAYEGTCQINVSGAITSARSIPCATTGAVYVGAIPQHQSVTVSVTAVEAGVTSGSASGQSPARNTWGYCPPSGPCSDPVSFPGDPDVDVVPAPWTPPEISHPPVLVAGLVLFGLAGALRQIRQNSTTTVRTTS